MPATPVIIAAAMLLFFAAIVALMLWQSRRWQQSRAQIMARHGLTLLDPPPDEYVRRILALQPARRSVITVTRLARRSMLDGELILYDLRSAGRENDLDQDNVMVVSPSLDLPRFALFPLPAFGVKAGGVVDRLVSAVADMASGHTGMVRARLPGAPEFEQRYSLMAEDEFAARDFFTPQRVGDLLALEQPVTLFARGDTYQVSLIFAQAKSPGDTLERTIQVARRLLPLLQG